MIEISSHTAERIEKAFHLASRLHAHLSPELQRRQNGRLQFLYVLLTNLADYVDKNAGYNPPSDRLTAIKHSPEAIKLIDKARTYLRNMYRLVETGNQKAVEGDHAKLQTLFKDWSGYFKAQMRREGGGG